MNVIHLRNRRQLLRYNSLCRYHPVGRKKKLELVRVEIPGSECAIYGTKVCYLRRNARAGMIFLHQSLRSEVAAKKKVKKWLELVHRRENARNTDHYGILL
jgi:hypothetical protein